ncbi:uncharacterized protein METZ01_LOCUS30858 [marine metagenome]|uniref:Uncharacterized protein n=1 Tax=marine metagenome TaxID=408172 RepID=A0A381QGH4_9ZZZZ
MVEKLVKSSAIRDYQCGPAQRYVVGGRALEGMDVGAWGHQGDHIYQITAHVLHQIG